MHPVGQRDARHRHHVTFREFGPAIKVDRAALVAPAREHRGQAGFVLGLAQHPLGCRVREDGAFAVDHQVARVIGAGLARGDRKEGVGLQAQHAAEDAAVAAVGVEHGQGDDDDRLLGHLAEQRARHHRLVGLHRLLEVLAVADAGPVGGRRAAIDAREHAAVGQGRDHAVEQAVQGLVGQQEALHRLAVAPGRGAAVARDRLQCLRHGLELAADQGGGAFAVGAVAGLEQEPQIALGGVQHQRGGRQGSQDRARRHRGDDADLERVQEGGQAHGAPGSVQGCTSLAGPRTAERSKRRMIGRQFGRAAPGCRFSASGRPARRPRRRGCRGRRPTAPAPGARSRAAAAGPVPAGRASRPGWRRW
jgi:hypothetical protein